MINTFVINIKGHYQSLKYVLVVYILTWKYIPYILSEEKKSGQNM